jgi:hypothetical protein
MDDELLGEIDRLSVKDWTRIPAGEKGETTVTQLLLDTIDEYTSNGQAKIKFDHTGELSEARTYADFILFIKDPRGNVSVFSFQAKKGFADSEDPNLYKQITERVGGKPSNPYQIDSYLNWANANANVDAYYIFYNGGYTNFGDNFGNENVEETSYWVEISEQVRRISMRNGDSEKYGLIRMSDLVKNNNGTHRSFIDFLKGVDDGTI